MAEISSGKDDQNVEKSGGFNLFGRSPARNLSKKKSNPLGRMFSLTRKKSEKQNVPDAESDISSTNDDDAGKQGQIDIFATIQKTAKETISEVTDEVVRYANIETIAQQTMSVNPDMESKESTPAIDEKKPEFFGKLLEKAEKTKEELMEKAEKTKEELLEKGNESLQEVFKALTHTNKAPAEQSTDDKNTTQEKSVNILTTDEVIKGPNMAQTLQDEVVAIVGVMQEPKEKTLQEQNEQTQPERKEETLQERNEETLQQRNEVTPQEDNQENVNEEENCVSSLAQGLQKICSTWNNKKED